MLVSSAQTNNYMITVILLLFCYCITYVSLSLSLSESVGIIWNYISLKNLIEGRLMNNAPLPTLLHMGRHQHHRQISRFEWHGARFMQMHTIHPRAHTVKGTQINIMIRGLVLTQHYVNYDIYKFHCCGGK